MSPDFWLWNTSTVRRVVYCLWMVVIVIAIPAAGSRVDLKGAGSTVPWRPPAKAYGAFWGALILALLVSWILVGRATVHAFDFTILAVGYFLLVASCVAWLFAYASKKIYGVVVFLVLLCVFSVLVLLASAQHLLGGSLLLPLGVWAVFQLCVNCHEIQTNELLPVYEPNTNPKTDPTALQIKESSPDKRPSLC